MMYEKPEYKIGDILIYLRGNCITQVKIVSAGFSNDWEYEIEYCSGGGRWIDELNKDNVFENLN